MFNSLEKVARSSIPRTPVLSATISKALETKNVNDDVSGLKVVARVIVKVNRHAVGKVVFEEDVGRLRVLMEIICAGITGLDKMINTYVFIFIHTEFQV